jgi:anti-anti-sigma factor
MSLSLASRFCGNVYVIQCTGRIAAGQETTILETALDEAEREFARVVLNLSEVTRMDSMGLGLLVRHASRLGKRGGTIRLAAPQSFVAHLLKITKLSSFLQSYPTEEDAIQSFLKQDSPQTAEEKRGLSVLVFDPAADLCMFVRTVLAQHGFDVKMSCSFRDAKVLLRVDQVDYILVGPGTLQLPSETVANELSALAPKASALQLSADFKSHDAIQATETLLHMFGVSSTPQIQQPCP